MYTNTIVANMTAMVCRLVQLTAIAPIAATNIGSIANILKENK
jgi:hypothetical protein